MPALRRALWVALILEAAVLGFASRPWTGGDTAEYLAIAEGWNAGGFGIIVDGELLPNALRPPGYPLLLWLLLHVFRLPVPFVVAAQLTAVLGGILLFARMTVRTLGPSAEVGLLAMCLTYPVLFAQGTVLQTEAWAVLFVAIAAVLLERRVVFNPRGAFLMGCVLALTVLFRPNLVLLPAPLLFASWALRPHAGGGVAFLRRVAMPMLLGFGLVVSPYVLYNERHFGRLSATPVGGAVGPSLYLAYWSGRVSTSSLIALHKRTFTAETIDAGLADDITELNHAIGVPADTPPINPIYYGPPEIQMKAVRVIRNRALEHIWNDPRSYGRSVARNIFTLWNTTHYPTWVPPIVATCLRIFSALIWLAGLGGLLLLVFSRTWRGTLLAPGLLVAYAYAIHVWLHLEARYTLPSRLPLLYLAAAFGVWSVQHFRNWRRADSEMAG